MDKNTYRRFENDKQYVALSTVFPGFDSLGKIESVIMLRFFSEVMRPLDSDGTLANSFDALFETDMVRKISFDEYIVKPLFQILPGNDNDEKFVYFVKKYNAYRNMNYNKIVDELNEEAEKNNRVPVDKFSIASRVLATGDNKKKIEKFVAENYKMDNYPFEIYIGEMGRWMKTDPYNNQEIDKVFTSDTVDDKNKNGNIFKEILQRTIDLQKQDRLTFDSSRISEKKRILDKVKEQALAGQEDCLKVFNKMREFDASSVVNEFVKSLTESTDQFVFEKAFEKLKNLDFDDILKKREDYLKRIDEEVGEREFIENNETYLQEDMGLSTIGEVKLTED